MNGVKEEFTKSFVLKKLRLERLKRAMCNKMILSKPGAVFSTLYKLRH